MDARTFWEKFRFEYRLDAAEVFRDLTSLEGYRLAAMNLMLPPEWREQLDKLNRVRAVYGTTALEGNPLSEVEVSHQMELDDEEIKGGRPRGRVTREQLQIRNAARAQSWVKMRFTPGSPPVMLEDILTMHRLISEESDETNNQPGALRTFSVQVGAPDIGGVHIGAPHQLLHDLMESFIRFINSPRVMSEHPVVQALLGHFFLVTIHPFGDGNGRVSRLLEAGILFQHGFNVHGFYGLSNFFYRSEGRYKELLQRSRRQVPFDVMPFVEFGVKGFVAELEGINNFVKTKINRVVYRQVIVNNREKLAGERRRVLNDREFRLLDFLLVETEPSDPFSPEPSRKIMLSELMESPYVKGAYRSVTNRTFYRELVRLADLGFIKFTTTDAGERSSVVELDFGAIAKYRMR